MTLAHKGNQMRRSTYYTSFILSLGLLMSLNGCNDSGDSIHQVVSNDSSGSLFDAKSSLLAENPWKPPTISLNEHTQVNYLGWELNSSLAENSRPGGIEFSNLGNGSLTETMSGYFSFQPSLLTSATQNIGGVEREELAFLSGQTATTFLARGNDNAIYQTSPQLYVPNIRWSLFLPASATVGTKWRWYFNEALPFSGDVFIAKGIGQISYLPKIRVREGALAPGESQDITRHFNAVDLNGVESLDEREIAIDYSTASGYLGSWLPVQRVGLASVSETGVTTPDGKFTGCIKVNLSYQYSVNGTIPEGYEVIGLDAFHGSYTLYWKPSLGWVAWSGSESAPRWGIDAIPVSTTSTSTFNLASYNSFYEQACLSYPYYGYNNYFYAWAAGFNAAYKDKDSLFLEYNRQELAAASDGYRKLMGIEDADLRSDISGIRQGTRAAADEGFPTGYAVGINFYAQDFTEIAGNDDILSGVYRSGQIIDFNLIPEKFRRNAQLVVNNYPGNNLLDNTSQYQTFDTYPHGIDGKGQKVYPYEPGVIKGISSVRLLRDASGNQYNQVYISLPIIGAQVTHTYSGAAATTSAALPGNG